MGQDFDFIKTIMSENRKADFFYAALTVLYFLTSIPRQTTIFIYAEFPSMDMVVVILKTMRNV